MSEITDAIAQNRRDLDKRDKQISADITRAWMDVGKKIEMDLLDIDLDNEWERYRYESLLRQVNGEVTKYANTAVKASIDRYTPIARERGEAEAMQLMRLQLPPDLSLSFNTLPVRPFETMFGTTTQGPLAELLSTFGPDIETAMRSELQMGIERGLNPREVARNMVKQLGTVPNRADNISRTEIIRAYRESSRQVYQSNSHVIKHYVRSSALDDRTCLTCWALHGTIYQLDEPMESHPRCRCGTVPVTKTWAELGYPNIPESHYTTASGSDYFKKLSPTQQKSILGPTAFEAYRNGSVDITDFVGRKESEKWGTTIYRRSNADVLTPTNP